MYKRPNNIRQYYDETMKKNRMVMGIEIMASTSKGLNRGNSHKDTSDQQQRDRGDWGKGTMRWIKDGWKTFSIFSDNFPKSIVTNLQQKHLYNIYI